jgi:hypothetical protein
MAKKIYVREREVYQKIEPFMKYTKFVFDTLIEIRNNNPGSSINNEVMKEVNKHAYTYTQKKMDQIRDSILYKEERKKQPEDSLQLALI